MINPPKRSGRYDDRDIDCQQAIEHEFQELMENVIAAGWGPEEVAEAIEALAMADRLARADVGRVDAQLEIARVMSKRS